MKVVVNGKSSVAHDINTSVSFFSVQLPFSFAYIICLRIYSDLLDIYADDIGD